MKHIFLIVFTLVSFASCRYTTGSGNIISETRSVSDFYSISVGGGFDVEVKTGPVISVMVEADDNIMKYIKTQTLGSTLKISTEDMHNYSNVHMKVYITTPSLKTIKASASAEVEVMDILKSNGKLSFKVSSGANIKAEIDAPDVESDVSSGGNINLSGKTKNYAAEASSGSEISAWDLLSENTTVKVSSGASAKVHASISLHATGSSGATVTYHGAANVSKSVSSGASVNKKD